MNTEDLLNKAVSQYLEMYENVREYLKSGGDITYAFLNLAKIDLEIASEFIRDSYCRKLVLKELEALKVALSFALLANEWKRKDLRFNDRVRLVGSAIKKIFKLAIIHFSRIL